MGRGKRKDGERPIGPITPEPDLGPPAKSVEELITEGRLERVPANPSGGERKIRQAHKHLGSADKLADTDPELAYAALYDGVRKSIDGHMKTHGIRPTAGTGGHIKTMEYAEAVLNNPTRSYPDLASTLDRMRRKRNKLEYQDDEISPSQVRQQLPEAREIVEAIARDLEDME